MEHINLDNKSLSELIELRNCFSGTNPFGAIDHKFKYALAEPYFKMMEHCKKRNCPKTKRFSLKNNVYR